jgi:hypothetical protein
VNGILLGRKVYIGIPASCLIGALSASTTVHSELLSSGKMNDILFILQDLKVCGNGMLIMLLNF